MTSWIRNALAWAFAFCLAPAPVLPAAEIYSNGLGGGAWGDAATWRGGVVPGPDDDVVIARDDAVVFDRNDAGRVTCNQLSLDPRSLLAFKTAAGPIVFTAAGAVESYGTIRLDATKAAADRHELRLVAEDPEQRTLKVAKGGGLVVAGRNVLSRARKNALISARGPAPAKPGDPPPDPTAILEATSGTLDLQRAELENVYVQAKLIDNTGAKPGERVNVVRNRFAGTSRLYLESCDTPLVADNHFERDAQPALQQAALYCNSCPLAEIRGNTIRGTYAGGLTFYGGIDQSVVDNLIENCNAGFYYYGTNGMIRRLTIRNSGHALTMTSASGTLEDVVIEKCTSGYYHGGATVQLTNLVVRDMQPNHAYDIYYASGPLTLLNCDLKPEQVTFHTEPPPKPAPGQPDPPWVTSLQYVVAQVSGSVPAGSSVEMKTANPAAPLPAGAADPNVRNSPAPIASSGFTPLPRSLEPLIVRSWMYDNTGRLAPAPDYQLRVLAPAEGEAERKVLKATLVTPRAGWYRPNPNDKKPTLEATVP